MEGLPECDMFLWLDRIALWYLTRPPQVARRLHAVYLGLLALLMLGIWLDSRGLIAATLPVLGLGCVLTLRAGAHSGRPMSVAVVRMLLAFGLLCLMLWMKAALRP